MVSQKSRRLFQTARQVMVGGVNSPVRAFRSVAIDPLIMVRGRGARLVDADGHAYQDHCLSWGALILGHRHPDVTKAVERSVRQGSSFGTTTKPEIELAQFIVKHVPSVDLVRFVNSGTEATMSAIRAARGFTKRAKIIKFDGCYHGHFDDFLIQAGSGVAGLPASSSLGIPAAHVRDTLSLPYNDAEELGMVIERHHKDLAAVIVEPVAGNMGVVLPTADFLRALRALTRKYGIVLIFDEVMTGFRAGLGCAQADFGMTPDLTCFGKIIGGGFPVGAYGGHKDIMRQVAPLGPVYQAGTFSGNPLVMAAGLATLKNLDASTYRRLDSNCQRLVAAANRHFSANRWPVRLVAYHSMMSLHFHSQPYQNYAEAQKTNSNKNYAELFEFLLKCRIYFPPANMETFFVSTAHQPSSLDHLLLSLNKFFKKDRV